MMIYCLAMMSVFYVVEASYDLVIMAPMSKKIMADYKKFSELVIGSVFGTDIL